MTDSTPLHRSACIVGAAGGIGSAAARLLAREGYAPLVLMDRGGTSLASLAAETGALAVELDLADPPTIAAAFAAAREKVPILNALVLCAGVVDTGKLETLTLGRFSEVVAINLTGTFLCCQAATEWLADGGRVVTLGSLAARTGGVITGAAYAASKGGVESLTKAVAQELAPRRITVNCIAPGAIDTPMTAGHPPERRAAVDRATPLGRHGRAEEVAATIAFLASEEAGYITGAVIPVNGGLRMD